MPIDKNITLTELSQLCVDAIRRIAEVDRKDPISESAVIEAIIRIFFESHKTLESATDAVLKELNHP